MRQVAERVGQRAREAAVAQVEREQVDAVVAADREVLERARVGARGLGGVRLGPWRGGGREGKGRGESGRRGASTRGVCVFTTMEGGRRARGSIAMMTVLALLGFARNELRGTHTPSRAPRFPRNPSTVERNRRVARGAAARARADQPLPPVASKTACHAAHSTSVRYCDSPVQPPSLAPSSPPPPPSSDPPSHAVQSSHSGCGPPPSLQSAPFATA